MGKELQRTSSTESEVCVMRGLQLSSDLTRTVTAISMKLIFFITSVTPRAGEEPLDLFVGLKDARVHVADLGYTIRPE